MYNLLFRIFQNLCISIFFSFFFCLSYRIKIQISFILLRSTLFLLKFMTRTTAHLHTYLFFFFPSRIYFENNLFWRFPRKSTFSRWKESLYIIFMEFSSFKSKGLKFIASLDFYFSFVCYLENLFFLFFTRYIFNSMIIINKDEKEFGISYFHKFFFPSFEAELFLKKNVLMLFRSNGRFLLKDFLFSYFFFFIETWFILSVYFLSYF